MGVFGVTVRIANPVNSERGVDLELMVDTGATLSSLPRSVLVSIGIRQGMTRNFRLADGSRVQRATGAVLATIDGVTMIIPTMFADEGDTPVLGATALEILGFAVDPVEQKLVSRDLLAL